MTSPDTPGLGGGGTAQYPPTYPREFPALGVTLNVYEGVVDVAIPVTPNARACCLEGDRSGMRKLTLRGCPHSRHRLPTVV